MKPSQFANTHEYTMRTTGATKTSTQMSFRHSMARRKQLEVFMYEDGHQELTPILREAIDFYVAERLRGGRDAVASGRPAGSGRSAA